jgi:hypothetical protein
MLLEYVVDGNTSSTFVYDFLYGVLGASSHICSDSDTVG